MNKDYVEKKLSNGIKVYFLKDDNMKRVHVSYNVNYGTHGYFDKFYYKGKSYHVEPAIAHFLEHMLIETSKRGNMLLNYMDRNYDANGVTFPEVTSYYFVAIDSMDKVKIAIKELIEMVEYPVFTEENIEKIKNAICEELKKGSDNKYQIARSNNRHNLCVNYDAVPIANNILGSIDSTMAITLEQAKVCYDAYYNDENKFILVGGAIDIDEMMEYLESIFKNIPAHPNEMKEFDYSPNFNVRCEVEKLTMNTDADYVIQTFKVKNDYDLPQLKVDLYIYIYLTLKFAMSTPFVEGLMKDDIITSGVSHIEDYFKGIIAISLSYETFKPEVAMKKIKDELNLENLDREEFELLRRTLVSDEIKRQDYIYSCLYRFPTVIDFSTHLMEIDTINSLNYDEMIEVIKKLDFSISTTTIITKKK